MLYYIFSLVLIIGGYSEEVKKHFPLRPAFSSLLHPNYLNIFCLFLRFISFFIEHIDTSTFLDYNY